MFVYQTTGWDQTTIKRSGRLYWSRINEYRGLDNESTRPNKDDFNEKARKLQHYCEDRETNMKLDELRNRAEAKTP